MDRLTYKNSVEYTNELYCGYENCDVLEDSCPLCQDDCFIVRNAIDKLAHYEELEEQGLMIELPCKVGDVVYKIAGKIIIAIDVRGFEIINNSIFILTSNYSLKFDVKLFNEVVFLTREQAELKLKEMGSERYYN